MIASSVPANETVRTTPSSMSTSRTPATSNTSQYSRSWRRVFGRVGSGARLPVFTSATYRSPSASSTMRSARQPTSTSSPSTCMDHQRVSWRSTTR